MRVTKKDKKLSLAISDIKFSVFEEEGTHRRVAGTMNMHVRRMLDNAMVKEYDASFPIVSLWQLPHIPMAIKAHVGLKAANGIHKWFRDDIRQIGEVKLNVGTTGMSAVEYSLMLDQRVLRYGKGSGKGGYISYRDDSSGKFFRIYESKAMAIMDILDVISINRAIGGRKKVNFSSISDEVLEGVGFTKIPDVMGVGISMWAGNPDSVAGEADNWDRVAKEKSMANTMSFLSIIQETIGAV